MKKRAALLLAVAPLGLSGCGLQPLYAGGGSGPVAASLSEIEVDSIAGKSGWLVKNALTDRLGVGGKAAPRYHLQVELDDQIQGYGLRTDNSITRERRSLRARYRLVDSGSGTVVLDATAGSDEGIDVVTSEYAVIAAEQTALEHLSADIADQIVQRLAVYARHKAAGQAGQ